jgi:hypothetical protein
MKFASVAVVIGAALAFACGGGGDNSKGGLTGDWELAIGTVCSSGAMSLGGASDDLTGNWECGTYELGGGASGSLKGNSVTLTLKIPGFDAILVNGTLAGDSISGTANGSGFKNDPFTAIRK